MLQINFINYYESIHLYQLYTGFGLLQAHNKCRCTYSPFSGYLLDKNGPRFLTLVLNDTQKIAYDMDDAHHIITDVFDWSDYYFKRSYSLDQHANYSPKIRPLGLYYLSYGPQMDSARRISSNLNFSRLFEMQKLIKLFLTHSPAVSKQFAFSGGMASNWYENFEGHPTSKTEPNIIFMSQVWPLQQSYDHEIKSERHAINEMRCACIRALRKEFHHQFFGGIFPSEYALANHKDCVIHDPAVFRKDRYLQRMHAADIGIATMGLFGSNGGKLAEYVAAAKAIVSENLHYQVPGVFKKNENYLEFSTPEECVAQVKRLVESPELRFSMMRKNAEYYNQFIRPDRLVWNSLQVALGQA